MRIKEKLEETKKSSHSYYMVLEYIYLDRLLILCFKTMIK